jgi:septal ring factor EnvC (AmiA/AmiB activator)
MRYITVLAIFLLPLASFAAPKVADPNKLDRELARLNREISTLRREALSLEGELSKLTKSEDRVRNRLVNDVQTLDKAVRDVVRLERSPKQALWAVDLLNIQSQRQQVISKSKESLSQRITDAEGELGSLFKTRQERWDKLQELAKKHKKLARKQRKLLRQQTAALEAAEITPAEKSRLQQRARRWQRANNLDGVFKDVVAAAGSYVPSGKIAGKLPATGQIVTGYHETDQNGMKSQGVVVATTPGADVITLQSGRIIYNGPFRDYGHLVILEHADGFHSVFSGLALNRRFQVGDVVTAETAIGKAPTLQNPHIYFELRQNGTPINPKVWLNASDDQA